VGALRHVAFRVDRASFEEARAELQRAGLDVHFEDHGIARSIYVRDPDGHVIELTTYEVS
jgi:catechol 2,3-dioxygenase-like lactoylglutathione lyase family enzyme